MEGWEDWQKVYQFGTIVIIPPDDVCAIVDEQRKRYDPVSQSCCGTHITVTQPLSRSLTEAEWAQLNERVKTFESFEIRYGPLNTFLPYPCVYYQIDPSERILEMRGALHHMGFFNLSLSHTHDFIPHMTITEGVSGPSVDEALFEKLRAESCPGSFRCTELAFIVPDEAFSFQVVDRLRFKSWATTISTNEVQMKFNLYNPTKIIFGEGRIKQLAREISKDDRVLLIYGGGSIKKNGVYDQVVAALEGYTWDEFSGIEPNPQYDTLMKAVEQIKASSYDFLLAVGGGSVIDGVKFISAAAKYPGDDPWDILEGDAKVRDAIPIGCVLTLPAAGSESNAGSVISRGTSKLFFSSPLVRPVFAILDPAVTMSLSDRQVANGIADAFVHIMEQYLTYPVNGKVQDRFSEGLLMTLFEEGPRVFEEPEDMETRANIMWAATQALNGLIGAGVPGDWTSHMIGHELTALYGIDHGRTLTIILPAVMKQRREQKREKLLQYAERVLGIQEGADDKRIDLAIERTETFFKQLGLPVSLGDVELGPEVIDPVIANLEKHERFDLGEHEDIQLEQSRQILEEAL